MKRNKTIKRTSNLYRNLMNRIFILIVTLSIFTASCNKDAAIEDNTINTGDLNLLQTDSFILKSRTVKDAALNGKNIAEVLLGKTSDNKIGVTKASFYTQLAITKNAFDLGANPILDSVVLILNQSNSYGKLNSLYDLKVYELTSEIDASESYKNNTVLNVNGTPLASLNNYKFNIGESSLRIPLSTTFGNSLLNIFGSSVMESTENFQAFFKGIYVTATSVNGDGLVSLKLNNDNSRLELFYNSDTQVDSSYTFAISTSETSISQYINENNSSEALIAANTNNTKDAYVASMSNFKSLISFPDLTHLQNVIINKAELKVYQSDYGSAESIAFPEPNQMILFQNLEDTSISYLNSYSINNYGPLGSKELVEVDGMNTNVYSFQITQYIQNLINKTARAESIYLLDVSSNEGNRIKLGGGNHPTLPMKLNIVYTVKN